MSRTRDPISWFLAVNAAMVQTEENVGNLSLRGWTRQYLWDGAKVLYPLKKLHGVRYIIKLLGIIGPG